MVQRLALTMSQNQKTSTVMSDSSASSSSVTEEERKVIIIGRKSTSTDSEDTSENSNSESAQNSSQPSSNRSSAELGRGLGAARARSSHVLIPLGSNLARMALMTPAESEENSPSSTPDTKLNKSWVNSEADSNLNKRRTGILLTRGRSTGEGTPQSDDAPNTPDSTWSSGRRV